MNLRTIAGVTVLAVISCGCAGTKVHFNDAPVSKLDLSQGRRVKAGASGLLLAGVIPIGVNDRQARAYERLLEKAGKDCVMDVKIRDSWFFAPIGWKFSTILVGTAYPYMSANNVGDKLKKLKMLRESGDISEKEYERARQHLIENIE